MRDMILSGLQNTKLFVVTENARTRRTPFCGDQPRTWFLPTSTRPATASTPRPTYLKTAVVVTADGPSGREETATSQGVDFGDSESSHSLERRHEAVAAVRLVNKDGDVIWSTTQESLGGKFHGASADVAEKVTKKLVEDYDRARKLK